MTYKLRLTHKRITDTEAFEEASADELRVLIAISENAGRELSDKELASIAHVSSSRLSAAVALWREVGVIRGADEQLIEEEFPGSGERMRDTDRPLAETAKAVRDMRLADLNSEIARILGLPSLNLKETETIVAAYKACGEDVEYMITLCTYLASRKKSLTVTYFYKELERLFAKDINTAEKLYLYIESQTKESEASCEYKRIMGIYGRSLSSVELEYITKWRDEFGYSGEIIAKAYGEATRVNKISLSYMHGILENWHKAGLKTVSEIDAYVAQGRSSEQKPAEEYQKTKKQTPRYGDFDINDAFAKALERSWGEDEK
jgi:DnaD/phage-associated family protein